MAIYAVGYYYLPSILVIQIGSMGRLAESCRGLFKANHKTPHVVCIFFD